jgi:hypothetical protein
MLVEFNDQGSDLHIGIIEFGAGKRPNNNHDLKFNWIWQNNHNISLIILSEGMMFIPIDPG